MTDTAIIEEMIKDLRYACTKKELSADDTKEIAKAFCFLGYRKIGEDFTVLNKKETQEMQELIKPVKAYLQKQESYAHTEATEMVFNEIYKILKADTINGETNPYKSEEYADFIYYLARAHGVEVKL